MIGVAGMATDRQIEFIEDLYRRLGMEIEDDIYGLTNREASDRIEELKEMLD